MRYIEMDERFTNYVAHPCGCRTAFDVVAWHSHAFERCPDHARVERETPERTVTLLHVTEGGVMNKCRGSDEMGSDFTHMRRENSVQQQTPNYAQMAVETGQLVYHDDVLDDDEGSPTYNKFVPVFYGGVDLAGEAK